MLKVSVSGIRGIWGESLNHETIVGYVKAFLAFIGSPRGKRIALGTDTRRSRGVIKKLVLSVLESYGLEVLDLDIVPTPLVLFAVKEKNLDGGIMISASHNPAPWNALKLIKKGGFFLNEKEIAQIQEIFDRKSFLPFSWEDQGTSLSYSDIVKEYIVRAETLVDYNLIRGKKIKAVADAVNGTAVSFLHALFQFLNVDHQILFSDITRDFERVAEPLPQNLEALEKEVRQRGADVGLAYDPDADRLALVDETGRAIGEDWTLAISYMNILEKQKTDIVVNLSTSRIIDEVARRAGTQVFKAKVGEINVTEKMLEKNIKFGGEGNGGVIDMRINHCRDSLIATLLVLEYLARSGKKLSEIAAEFPVYLFLKEKINAGPEVSVENIAEKLRTILEDRGVKILETSVEDGIRIDYEEGWIQVRSSNTEPIVRVMSENRDRKFHEWIKQAIKNGLSG